MKKQTNKGSITNAFFTAASWVLNIGAANIEWVFRNSFRLMGLLWKGFLNSHRQQDERIKWKVQRIFTGKSK
jgi:hypothetical protein